MPAPLPPTPALPRFAEHSLLFATEPIFDADVSFNVDWLEPLTPKAGPSRLRDISPVRADQDPSRGDSGPYEHEDPHQRMERLLSDEPVLSGRGEKQTRDKGLALSSRAAVEPRNKPEPSGLGEAPNERGQSTRSIARHSRIAMAATSRVSIMRTSQHRSAPVTSTSALSTAQPEEVEAVSSQAPAKRPSAPPIGANGNRVALGEVALNEQTDSEKAARTGYLAGKTATNVPIPTQKKSALSRYLAKAAQDRPGVSHLSAQASVPTSTRPRTEATDTAMSRTRLAPATRPIIPASDTYDVPDLPTIVPGAAHAEPYPHVAKDMEAGPTPSVTRQAGTSRCEITPACTMVETQALGMVATSLDTESIPSHDCAVDDDDELEVPRERMLDEHMEEPIAHTPVVDDFEALGGIEDDLLEDASYHEPGSAVEGRHLPETPPPTPPPVQESFFNTDVQDGLATPPPRTAGHVPSDSRHGTESLDADAEGASSYDIPASPAPAPKTSNNQGKKRGRESLLDMVTGFLRRSTSSLSLRGGEGKEALPDVTSRARSSDAPEEGDKSSSAGAAGLSGEGCSPPRKVAKRSTSQAAGTRPKPPVGGYIPLTRPMQPRLPRPDAIDRTARPAEASLGRTKPSNKAYVPLQPSNALRPVSNNARPNPVDAHAKPSSVVPVRKPPVPRVGVRAQGAIAPSGSMSAFAAAALARLPPPGKGASAAAAPVRVKTPERARDLARRRSVFEAASALTARANPEAIAAQRPLGPSSVVQATSRARGCTSSGPLARTEPVRGHTPGKASRARAERREAFDAGLRARNEEKERARREEQRRREEEEERMYRQRRKETVIWAKGVPDMYRRGAERA